MGDDNTPSNCFRACDDIIQSAFDGLKMIFFEFLLHVLQANHLQVDFRKKVCLGSFQQLSDFLQQAFFFSDVFIGLKARDSFDPSYSLGDSRFAGDRKKPDLSRKI